MNKIDLQKYKDIIIFQDVFISKLEEYYKKIDKTLDIDFLDRINYELDFLIKKIENLKKEINL